MPGLWHVSKSAMNLRGDVGLLKNICTTKIIAAFELRLNMFYTVRWPEPVGTRDSVMVCA